MLMGLVVSAVATLATPDVQVAAIRARARDFDEAIAFYTTHLECTVFSDARSEGFVVLDCDGVHLVLTPAEATRDVRSDDCHARINFRVPDLEEAVESMKAAGVRFDGGPKRSAIGRYRSFFDPTGNRHTLKQLDESWEGQTERTGVFNVGISVSSMDEALDFYGDLLGFEVLSRNYYPPVVPMKIDGAVSFILADGGTRKATTPAVGLAFSTPDLDLTMDAMTDRGIDFLNEPTNVGPVRVVNFTDPFGTVHDLIEFIASDDASQAVQIDDLGWITGTWRADYGPTLLEETWSTPAGDAMCGMFRWVNDGQTSLFELMTIEQRDEGIVFHLRHFDPGLKVWASEADGPMVYPLKSASENRVVFENPEGKPKRFVYERDGDALKIRLESEDGDGDEYRFKRTPAGSR